MDGAQQSAMRSMCAVQAGAGYVDWSECSTIHDTVPKQLMHAASHSKLSLLSQFTTDTPGFGEREKRRDRDAYCCAYSGWNTGESAVLRT